MARAALVCYIRLPLRCTGALPGPDATSSGYHSAGALTLRDRTARPTRCTARPNPLADSIVVHSYTRQVVAGTKYNVKLAREDGTFSHFSVIKPLPHKNEAPFILGEVQDGLTAEDTFN